MRLLPIVLMAFLFATSAGWTLSRHPVRIVVEAPLDTPPDEPLYLAGSLPAVGSWKADGLRLHRQADGRYVGELDLEIGVTLEFKITRGGWETVEKHANGSERPNRVVTIDADLREITVKVDSWAGMEERVIPKRSTVVGELRLHEIDSASLGTSRTIRVWLPPGYDAQVQTRFGVLYMHDGQNLFDRATSAFGNEWEIDESLTRLIGDGGVRPLIVVGIDNGGAQRIKEYTYDVDPRHGGGGGTEYAQFLLAEVKPSIEKTYRIQTGPQHTFLGGSSLGAVISLEIARRHPGTFGGVIAMSPALQWAGEALTQSIERDAGGLVDTRVWLDMGTREGMGPTEGAAGQQNGRTVTLAHRLADALIRHGVEHHLEIDEEFGDHNEIAWAHRFPEAISYITGSNR